MPKRNQGEKHPPAAAISVTQPADRYGNARNQDDQRVASTERNDTRFCAVHSVHVIEGCKDNADHDTEQEYSFRLALPINTACCSTPGYQFMYISCACCP